MTVAGTAATVATEAAAVKGARELAEAPALMLSAVGKRYPKFELKDVSFVLPRGYIMGFIGPNGAGKSTTIKIVMNMVRKSRGTVKVLGLDHVAFETEVKRHVGYLGEEPHFYEEVSPAWLGGFVGNYAEIFERNLSPLGIPRGLNRQWTDGGLLFAYPFR